MKIIDVSTGREPSSGSLVRRVSMKFSGTGPEDAPAQDKVIASLQKALSNHYVLMRNILIDGLETSIPLILIGPPGVRVILANAQRGVYRARGEDWEKLDDRQQKFRPVSPNLLTWAVLMSRGLDAFLASRGIRTGETEPVLVFPDPGVHVDATRPVARVVLADAIDRFISSLNQSRILLNQEEIEKIVSLLAGTQGEDREAASLPFERDDFSFLDEEKPKQPGALEKAVSAQEQAVLARVEKLPFSGRQWAILGLIIFVNILLITGFVLLVLISS